LTTTAGWIIAAFGAGAAAGALLLTVRGWLPRAGALQTGTLFLSSTALGLVALAGSTAVAGALALLGGLLGGICGGLATVLIQTSVGPGYLGRVTAVMSLTGFGIAPLVYPVFGAAVAAWGPEPVFLTGAAFACLGGVVGLAAPAVRRAELSRPDARADSAGGQAAAA
jgi:MFS family permease